MKNLLMLLVFSACIGALIFIGTLITNQPPAANNTPRDVVSPIPHLGSIELLNGCGIDGAAQEVADFLRANSFDVKSIGNAPTWNYSSTLVISRTSDTTMAAKVASALKTDKMTIIRNNHHLYDVTVFIGSDYKERIQ